MDERDSELDKILKPLMDLKPNSEQLRGWKNFSLPSKLPRRFVASAVQLAAACLIGFVLGYFVKNKDPMHEASGNFQDSATIEVVYTKNE